MTLPCKRALFLVVLAMVTALSGCRQSTEVLGRSTQTYFVKGTVLATDPAAGEITLQHEAIPGFMDAMTMPYKLDHTEAVAELHAGDVIRARILVDKDSDGVYHHARLNEIAVIAQKKLDNKPQTQYHVPIKGDVVPDFAVVDQDGHATTLATLTKGKATLLTFIYTRCPLGDFCPKMTKNFQAIRGMVNVDKKLVDGTDFVSVSFDPAFDTPTVLKAYGKNYVGNDGFAHWQFVRTRDDAALKTMEQFFNVGVTTGENTIQHSLSTVLIDRDGRIAEWLPGGEWSPGETYLKLRTLAQK